MQKRDNGGGDIGLTPAASAADSFAFSASFASFSRAKEWENDDANAPGGKVK